LQRNKIITHSSKFAHVEQQKVCNEFSEENFNEIDKQQQFHDFFIDLLAFGQFKCGNFDNQKINQLIN
jgi:hypothetical protein